MPEAASAREVFSFPEPHAGPVAKLLEDARKYLVETGARNRLIHVNRRARRANVVNVVNERSDDVFRILTIDRAAMRFLPDEAGEESGDTESPALDLLRTDDEVDEARYTDRNLETRLRSDPLQKRLLKIARDAATSEEEQGVNVLYLALGFLTWFESENSEVAREAPLILLPVSLRRNPRTSTYDLVCRDDDIVTNLSLQERLKGDFGIALPDIPDTAEWSPSQYFEQVRHAVISKQRWSIDENSIQLGFFSFSKLLMLRDLDPQNWPASSLVDHPLLSGLLAGGFESEPSAVDNEESLDAQFAPADLIQVVDADSSQTKVIEDVRSGRNLVVQGPPGTGKSQTITNIIAAAVHDGKSVLFVAEKMAALSVVHRRLVKAGLRDVCLELHSKNASKKAVLEEIGQTLNAARAIPDVPGPPAKLQSVRDELNALSSILHAPIGETGETPFRVVGMQTRCADSGAPPPSSEIENVDRMSRKTAERLIDSIQRYGELLEQGGAPRNHPFWGVRQTEHQPVDLERAIARQEQLASAIRSRTENYNKITTFLGIPDEATFDQLQRLSRLLTIAARIPASDPALVARVLANSSARLRAAAQVGLEWRRRRDALNDTFSDVAWDFDPSDLRTAFAAGAASFLARLGGRYRAASNELAGLLQDAPPKSAAERLKLVDDLLSVRTARKALAEEESVLESGLGEHWRGERTDFSALIEALDWSDAIVETELAPSPARLVQLATRDDQLKKALAAIRVGPVVDASRQLSEFYGLRLREAFGYERLEEIPFANLLSKIERFSGSMDRFGEWAELAQADAALRDAGAASIADRMAGGDFSGAEAATEFTYARAEAIWKRAITEHPKLRTIGGDHRRMLVSEFQELERARFDEVARLIRCEHLDKVPQGAVGEMGVIRGELAKRRRHIPIRKLVSRAGGALQKIKPVLLMSPLSVAQFLPPGRLEFDLLVIDEASQVRPEDALGAIARARQIVVVGDKRQLPPSSFFDRLTSDINEDEDDAEDNGLQGAARASEMESVLSLCEARGLPDRMLEWHYRSRDPSLIAVSNDQFYGGRLILPPSPVQHDQSCGLSLTQVEGAFDRGKKRTNRIEAEAVVNAVAAHAAASPNQSLGVVTFSIAQRDLISELLEFERRRSGVLDAFLREGRNEDFFVKNLENVQGDERDVMFVSVGYGPSVAGRQLDSMSFGPVNRDGGERRLNVIFTRSRIRCEVFVSFHPGDISLERTKAQGARVLKRFLEFAQTGILDERAPTGEDADSPFEEAVADAIRDMGYPVDFQVGSAGFRIDLGVRHPERPGQYILAVECDGATYHSALWARERDRLRQDVLEHLGWRFHRIWSTDWFYRRAEERRRLLEALKEAQADADAGVHFQGANDQLSNCCEAETDAPEELEEDDVEVVVRSNAPSAPPYRKADLQTGLDSEPHLVPVTQLAELALKIVEIEGPIHQNEVARRVASAFGKERTGSRIASAVAAALKHAHAKSGGDLKEVGGFWLTADQNMAPPVRDRSAEAGSLLKADMLPPMEVAAAIRTTLADCGSVQPDELAQAVARVLGFKRTGPEIKQAIASVIDELVSRGELSDAAEGLRTGTD